MKQKVVNKLMSYPWDIENAIKSVKDAINEAIKNGFTQCELELDTDCQDGTVDNIIMEYLKYIGFDVEGYFGDDDCGYYINISWEK